MSHISSWPYKIRCRGRARRILLNEPKLAEQIIDLYRYGFTKAQIAQDYVHEIGFSGDRAHYAIGSILKYSLSSDELSGLTQEHRSRTGKINGTRTYEQRKGAFELTREQISRAGKKGGRKIRREGKGLLSPEARMKALEARGIVPRPAGFETEFLRMRADPEYRNESGYRKGRPDYARIAEELNRLFGMSETAKTLGYYKWYLGNRAKKEASLAYRIKDVIPEPVYALIDRILT